MKRSGWVVTLWLILVFDALAAGCDRPIGRIISAEGSVEVRTSARASLRRVSLNDAICPESIVISGERSRAAVLMLDGEVLRLAQNSSLSFSQYSPERPWLIELLEGWLYFFSPRPTNVDVHTRYMNLGVRGTEFVIHARPGVDTNIWVLEGLVEASNPQGTVQVRSGETAVAKTGRPPVTSVLTIRPRDAVTWALHYPPIIDDSIPDSDPASAKLHKAMDSYRLGSLSNAFKQLDDIPSVRRSARFYNMLAGLLLTVGRVDDARQALEQALQLHSRNATAFALQSVIEVAQNNNEKAFVLAQQAVAADPQSGLARVALSYVYQAQFELEKARDSTRQATQLSPGNALTWARLSELELSFGEQNKALKAAERALSLNPHLARTHSVLGFAHLSSLNVDRAKAAFETAIRLDQASPLPRLGLGLARIRLGKLAEGRGEIEIAAALDPNNSLIRSYLGKAYFEEKRDTLDGKQYEIAKKLDNNDPTPWFYDAIRKQTINRPIEALRDLQESLKRNGNRAVYRSRLMLDRDLASRGASMARIYDDLGFNQLARAEAYKWVSLDPSNHSAHRFLSDAYARLPRHEIARVSELLQAQLLQPVSINPIQPSLPFVDLNPVTTIGTFDSGFNEFDALFERNRTQLVASTAVGNQSTIGGELVVSGVKNNLAFSVGGSGFETDGFRANSDQTNEVYNLFTQWTVSPKASLQAEFRYRDTEQGDLELRFDPSDFFPRDRRKVKDGVARVGARLSNAPGSTFILSGIYADLDDQLIFVDEFDGSIFTTDEKVNDKGFQTELQYMREEKNFNWIAGLGALDTEVNLESVGSTDGVIESISTASFDRKHYKAYVYSSLFFPIKNAQTPAQRGIRWTVGAGYSSLEQDKLNIEEFEPKVGVELDVTQKTRLRAAYFKTVKRPLVIDQTIEPTEIAGFNQLFDDANGTEAIRYGVGIDSALSNELFAGIEISRREVEFPFATIIEERREGLSRAYLNWMLGDRWALTLDLVHEKYRNRNPFEFNVDTPLKIDSLTLPISARYFDPNGFFAKVQTTYLHQDVERGVDASLRYGEESVILLDTAIGYRLPRRRGIISFEVQNALDESFFYQDDNFRSAQLTRAPSFVPERRYLISATIRF